jgi:hypothetical protein
MPFTNSFVGNAGGVVCVICTFACLLSPRMASGEMSSSVKPACADLASIPVGGAKVISAVLVTTLGDVPDSGSLNREQSFPEFCRIRLIDRPSPDSEIRTEIWLPKEGWNGRYWAQGNSAFGGVLPYDLMFAAVSEGYATSGTDTGHVGPSPAFALGHPEKVEDFGWRAIHDMTVEAKEVIRLLYGKVPERSYFSSCSNGGREALIEAQRFPADYDGLLAGAPAYNWTALVAAGALIDQTLLASPEGYIPAGKIPAIAAAVRALCDQQDGLTDGVVTDPRRCAFRPSALACKQGDQENCLTQKQIAALQEIYAAKLDDHGREVFPGYLPGAEDGPEGWSRWITGSEPGSSSLHFFATSYFGDFVYEQPEWKLSSFSFDKDLKRANEKTASALNATETDLRPFIDRGGKLILYHGWSDPAIPAMSTLSYYVGVKDVLGENLTNTAVRLYMVPGMQHCANGPGASSFGQEGGAVTADGRSGIFDALQQWVEEGKAPGKLTANKFVEGNPLKGVEFSRPLCPYPTEPKYVQGDVKLETSFVCGSPY